MKIIECLDYLPIPYKCDCDYKGIAYDSCSFYLTCPSCCQIVKFDNSFCKKKCYDVCKPYTSICYDCCNSCFWTLCENCPSKIYKLDKCLNEIDCFTIELLNNLCVNIKGISCNGKNLIICGDFGIALLSKIDGSFICCIEECTKNKNYLAIENYKDEIYTAYKMNNCSMIEVKEKECKENCKCCIPNCYNIIDMALNVCDCEIMLYILIKKNNCYPYILCCKIKTVKQKCVCCDPCEDYDCCKKECNCCQSANDIIESISLVETALSHILNAEGEKIQKILEKNATTCDILKVNDAVSKTIVNATHLEQILYAKLQIAQELCKDEKCCYEHMQEFDCCNKIKNLL